MNQKAIIERVKKEVSLHFTIYRKFILPHDYILDIGTGTGNTAHLIQMHMPTVSVLGLDIVNMLKKPIPITLYEGKKIPFRNTSYDVSLLFYVLHHIKKPQKLLEEAARITKRTIIVIEEFPKPRANHAYNLTKELEVLKAIGLSTDVYHHRLTLEKLDSMISNVGFLIQTRIHLPTKSEQKIDKYLYILHRKSSPKA